MTNFKSILNEMINLYEKKNKDYGNSFHKNWERFGATYPIPRMYEKLDRIASIAGVKTTKVSDETIEDTLLDLANMCVMTIMEIRLEGKEVKEKITKEDKEQRGVNLAVATMKAVAEEKDDDIALNIIEDTMMHDDWEHMPEFMQDDIRFVHRLRSGLESHEEVMDNLLGTIKRLIEL